MLLNEFFGNSTDFKSKSEKESGQLADDLFWFILDHDRLHKDYFFPIAKKLSEMKSCSDEQVVELFMPMVKKGCLEYYTKNKMKGKVAKLFPKELREELCEKLYDHFNDDVKHGKYKLK